MREVGVHLEEEVGALLHRLTEAGDVGLAQAFLGGAVQDGDVRVLFGEAVGEPAGAVGRVVVDDQRVELNAVAVGDLANAVEGVRQVLALVVGGNDDGVHDRPVYVLAPAAGEPRGGECRRSLERSPIATSLGLPQTVVTPAEATTTLTLSLDGEGSSPGDDRRKSLRTLRKGLYWCPHRHQTQYLVGAAASCVARSVAASRAKWSIRATRSRAIRSAGVASASTCERRFTTYERVEEVPARGGQTERTRRGVHARASCSTACCAPVRSAASRSRSIERIVDEIENELRRESGQRVTTAEVGERALRHLRELDKVAYVRFASVYRQFEDIDEFHEELARL